jgi:hypothetical protein
MSQIQIPISVALDFVVPKIKVTLRTRFASALVAVPKTAMHEYDYTPFSENNIGFSR